MNIEEERKAFEAGITEADLMPALSTIWAGDKYIFRSQKLTHKPLLQVYFEVWLKAKAHAEEILKAKKRARIRQSSATRLFYALVEDRNWRSTGTPYNTANEAAVWLSQNGYQVIE